MGTEIFFGKSEIRLDTPVDKQPDGQITTRYSGCSPDGAKRNPGPASRETRISLRSIRATMFANVIARSDLSPVAQTTQRGGRVEPFSFHPSHALDISCGKWSASVYGRSDFPAEPTRVDGRIRRCGARSCDTTNGCRSGAPVRDTAGQCRYRRDTPGRAGDADLVARGTDIRPQLETRRHA